MPKKAHPTVVLREKEPFFVIRVGIISSTNAAGPTYLQIKDSKLPKGSLR
jgi:hypothetical protein